MSAGTALVTGARGQDGKLLTNLLLARGYEVLALIRPGTCASVDFGKLSGLHVLEIDLRAFEAVQSLLELHRPQEIYHLAAVHHSSQDTAASDQREVQRAMIDLNFLAAKHLAYAMLELKLDAHLVFASSSQVFTAEHPRQVINEDCQRKPSTFYGLTKSWTMDLLSFLRRSAGLRASSAILFNHESPERNPRFVTRKVTQAAAAAAMGMKPVLALQNIGAEVDWSSADDVVAGIHALGCAQRPGDYVFASETSHSVRELLALAFGHVGLDWKQFATWTIDQPQSSLVGCTVRARSELGWACRESFENLIVRMVDADAKRLRPATR